MRENRGKYCRLNRQLLSPATGHSFDVKLRSRDNLQVGLVAVWVEAWEEESVAAWAVVKMKEVCN